MEIIDSNSVASLGGIVSAQIVRLSDVQWFFRFGRRCLLSVATVTSWMNLLLADQKSQLDESSSDESGFSLVSSKLVLPLRSSSEDFVAMLSEILLRGCLIKVTFATGLTYIYGTQRHPLTGSVVHVPGSKHSDSPYYRIEASAYGRALILGG